MESDFCNNASTRSHPQGRSTAEDGGVLKRVDGTVRNFDLQAGEEIFGRPVNLT